MNFLADLFAPKQQAVETTCGWVDHQPLVRPEYKTNTPPMPTDEIAAQSLSETHYSPVDSNYNLNVEQPSITVPVEASTASNASVTHDATILFVDDAHFETLYFPEITNGYKEVNYEYLLKLRHYIIRNHGEFSAVYLGKGCSVNNAKMKQAFMTGTTPNDSECTDTTHERSLIVPHLRRAKPLVPPTPEEGLIASTTAIANQAIDDITEFGITSYDEICQLGDTLAKSWQKFDFVTCTQDMIGASIKGIKKACESNAAKERRKRRREEALNNLTKCDTAILTNPWSLLCQTIAVNFRSSHMKILKFIFVTSKLSAHGVEDLLCALDEELVPEEHAVHLEFVQIGSLPFSTTGYNLQKIVEHYEPFSNIHARVTVVEGELC